MTVLLASELGAADLRLLAGPEASGRSRKPAALRGFSDPLAAPALSRRRLQDARPLALTFRDATNPGVMPGLSCVPHALT